MEYRRLGATGVRVSSVGLGANQFGSDKVPVDEVKNIVDCALDLGINHVDTADSYQGGRSEKALGEAIKGRWDRVVLATKFYSRTGDGPNDRGASRYHLRNAVEASLRRLQTDHIDLYYMHRWDDETPIEETLRTLDDLISAGKVRYIGASAFAAWQLAKANLLAELRGWERFVALQSHYHLLERGVEKEVLPYSWGHGVGFIPFFPLAGGFLTGKYRRGEGAPAGSRGESSSYVGQYMTKANYDRVEALEAWAAERERQMNELAIAWLLAQEPVASVIAGATSLAHVESNAQAASWTLGEEEVGEVNAILEDTESEM